MKKLFATYVFIFVGILIFTACGLENLPPASTTAFVSPTITLTSTATQTLTPWPTETLYPTYTLTPTITQTPTFTVTSPPRYTPIPTLSSGIEMNDYLIDLSKTNGGCDIPCWLGIEVGSSTWQDVRLVFQPLTSQGIPDNDNSFDYHYWFSYALDTYFFVTMAGEPRVDFLKVLHNISFELEWRDYNDVIVKTYSLPKILSTNGVPSSVYLGAVYPTSPSAVIVEHLYLVYDEKNIIIKYKLLGNPDIGEDKFCFDEDWIYEISMYAASKESDYSLFDMVELQKDRYVSNIQSITGLEPEDFYNVVMSGESEPCFQLVNP